PSTDASPSTFESEDLMRMRAVKVLTALTLAAGVAGLTGCGLTDSVTESGQITSIDSPPDEQNGGECTLTLQPDNGKPAHQLHWTNGKWCDLVDYGPYRLHTHGTPEVRQRQYE